MNASGHMFPAQLCHRWVGYLLGALVIAKAGLVGAVAGYTVGAGIAVAQDAASGCAWRWSWTHPAAAIATVATVSVAAVVAASIYASYRDHARSRQE